MPISATGSHSCVFSRHRRRSGLSGARTIRLLIMHQKIAGPRDPIILVVRPGLQMGVMYCHPPPDRGVDTVGGRESHGSPRKKCRSCQVWVAYQSAERKCPPRRARKAPSPAHWLNDPWSPGSGRTYTVGEAARHNQHRETGKWYWIPDNPGRGSRHLPAIRHFPAIISGKSRCSACWCIERVTIAR